MQQLQAAQLGRCEIVSEHRDKFVLDANGLAAHRLASNPDADGFIRADRDTLLFRHPSEVLEKELVTPELRAHLKPTHKGVEFRWTSLDVSDIHTFFTKVRALASPA